MAVSRKGKLLHGQQFDPHSQVGPIPYTKQMQDDTSANALVGNENTEIQPIDAQDSEVTIFDVAAIAAILDDTNFVYADTVNFQLPDVLTGVTVSFNKTLGNGTHVQEAGFAASSGTSGGLDFNPSASAEGSAAIIPDAQPIIKQFLGQDVTCKRFLFYLPGDSITTAAILTKLNTIQAGTYNLWPVWKPESVVLTLQGQQVSLTQSAQSHHRDQWSLGATVDNISESYFPTGGSLSEGFSKSVGVSTRTQFIPPTLHAQITLSSPTDTASTTTTVKADIPTITGTGGAPSYSSISNHPTPLTMTANGAVLTANANPALIPATSPTTVPVTGLYVRDIKVEFYGFGYAQVACNVVDFSRYA